MLGEVIGVKAEPTINLGQFETALEKAARLLPSRSKWSKTPKCMVYAVASQLIA
jgi:hypothetical protein